MVVGAAATLDDGCVSAAPMHMKPRSFFNVMQIGSAPPLTLRLVLCGVVVLNFCCLYIPG